MPRPKVRLEDRQRVIKACPPCKASKKRCDGHQPCSNCIRRRVASACKYNHSSHVEHQSRAPEFQAATSTTQLVGSTDNEANHPRLSPRKPLDGLFGYVEDNPRNLPTSNTQRLHQGRMLLNSKGERVYIGKFASLSFLRFLRHTIKQQMGPSLFTENTRRDVMLEAAQQECAHIKFVEDDHEKDAMIEVYFAATNGVLDLFSRDEVAAYLTLTRADDQPDYNYPRTILDLIVSIGSQCRAQDMLDRRYATTLFSRARKVVMSDGLEDPSIDMVRCFLLMTFYMLGACRRNAAFMYLGIASQASSALGLHVTEQYRKFSDNDQDVRLRTLRSLRVLDVICCSILGRPYATEIIRTSIVATETVQIPSTAVSRNGTIKASFDVASVIAEITPLLDAEEFVDLSMAERSLKKLKDWSASLPAEMRQFNRSTTEPLTLQDQERTIGNIHVSCIYYFAIMLITRPSLITYLMARMSITAESGNASTRLVASEVADLPQACIDAAMLMANVCNEALQSGILLRQMCILKAWIFAAGLVLGFSMFAQSESRFDMDDAFSNAREVLRSFSAESPQAEHYYEILTGLADVVQRRRQHMSRGSRPSGNKYVNQILTFDVGPGTSGSQSTHPPKRTQSNEATSQEANLTTTGVDNLEFQMPDVDSWPLEDGGEFDFGMFGWDNFAIQISENFMLDGDLTWSST